MGDESSDSDGDVQTVPTVLSTPTKRRRFDSYDGGVPVSASHSDHLSRPRSSSLSSSDLIPTSIEPSSDTESNTHSSISILFSQSANLSFDYDSYTQYTPPQIMQTPAHGRKSFNFLNPLRGTGLYKRMVQHYDSIDKEVGNLICDIQGNFDRVHDLLQVIPDLLVVNYKVEEYSSQDYLIQIGPLFEAEARQNQNIVERDIIFNHKSDYAKNLSNLIDVFLWHLCKKLTSDLQQIILAERIFRVFISFIRQVSGSELHALRLTAFTFAFRISKFMAMRKLQLVILDSKQNFNRAAELIASIDDILENNNIDAICNGLDTPFPAFDLEFAKDIGVCMVACDKLFVNNKNLDYLAEILCTDSRTATLLTTIATCKLFINNDNLRYMLEMNTFQHVLEAIYDCLNSPSNNVIIFAAGFFARAFKRGYAMLASTDIMRRLLVRSFSLDLKIAQACGHALANHLAQFDKIQIYQRIIQYAIDFDRDTGGKVAIPYLVEALYPHLSELRHQEILMLLTKPSQFTPMQFDKMMEMLYFVCYLHIRGDTSIKRTRPTRADRTASQDSHANYDVAHWLLKCIPAIMRENVNNDSLNWMFKSLALLSFKNPDMFQLKNLIGKVLEISVTYFDSDGNNKQALWQSITRVIKSAAEMTCGQNFSMMLEAKLYEAVRKYKVYLQQLRMNDDEAESSLEGKLKVVCELKKIQSILESGYSGPIIDLDLFYRYWVYEKFPNDIIEGQVMCCAFYFKNLVLQILASDEDEIATIIDADTLRNNAVSYWKSLDALFLEKPDLHKPVFESMGIFMNHYKLLFSQANLHKHPHLRSAYVHHLRGWDSMSKVIEFFYESCVHSNTRDEMPLLLRQMYVPIFVGLFVSAILNDTFPIDYLYSLLVISHECFKLYPDCEHILTLLLKRPDQYFRFVTDILVQHSDESNASIDDLTDVFVDITPEELRLQFVQFAINNFVQNGTYEALQLLRPFIHKLDEDDKKIIFDLANDIHSPCAEVTSFILSI